jgi:hypothetical protein
MTTISTHRPATFADVDRVLHHALHEADRDDWSLLRSARRIAVGAQQDPELLQLARGDLTNGQTIPDGPHLRRALVTITVAIAMATEHGDDMKETGHRAPVPVQPR